MIVYSTYGHAKTLAEEVVKGVEEAGGEPRLYQARRFRLWGSGCLGLDGLEIGINLI